MANHREYSEADFLDWAKENYRVGNDGRWYDGNAKDGFEKYTSAELFLTYSRLYSPKFARNHLKNFLSFVSMRYEKDERFDGAGNDKYWDVQTGEEQSSGMIINAWQKAWDELCKK